MLLLLAAATSPALLQAQISSGTQVRGQYILSEIDRDYRRGEIDIDEKILYQFYAGMKPDALPAKYRDGTLQTIKCATPILLDYRQNRDKLASATIAEIDALMDNRDMQLLQQETYLSPSGKFLIHYDTTGTDAVPSGDADPVFGGNGIPDYIDWIAEAADSSWRHQVQRLGFTDPVTPNVEPYEIYAYHGNDYIYGETTLNGESTRIFINDKLNTSPFQNNDDVNPTYGAIKVTVAHELKHAIQYANSRWRGEAGSFSWSEMDATLMEEVVYDNVNDYYNYITESSSIFLSSTHSIPASYNGVTWFIFMTEFYDIDFWVRTWNLIREGYEEEKDKSSPEYPEMIATIDSVLTTDYSDFFPNAFSFSHLWHFASGPTYSVPGSGFDEGEFYPDPNINNPGLQGIDEEFSDTTFISSQSARYYLARPGVGDTENIAYSIDTNSPDLSVGFVFYLNDGGIAFESVPVGRAGETDYESIYKWQDVGRVGIVVANASDRQAAFRYRLYSTIPQEYTLTQNFPNPFNPSTTIRFTIPQASDVQLRVYDVTGRLVQTLVEGRVNPDFYEIRFNGDNLASGVYLYRLVTDQSVITRKMTLIK
ncbi:MAG: T9SS type A sorting domain-containing protein [Balneolaceae bacterium]|nr:T9SS type A sorting domain-containing protein [Balneolaceae bacterium]